MMAPECFFEAVVLSGRFSARATPTPYMATYEYVVLRGGSCYWRFVGEASHAAEHPSVHGAARMAKDYWAQNAGIAAVEKLLQTVTLL